MHSVRLNIENEFYEKFIDFMSALPKNMVEIEEVDDIPYYPSISLNEAKQKVQNAIEDMDKNKGMELETTFNRILAL
ncbi:MAG: hypothetical protein U9N49_02845 [Campylobacterota bacterium]|nr:hypothetical protein [Campylobacterota bacterium]